MEFKNKIVLVTGGSQGIGESIVKKFLEEGAKVIVFDIKKPKADIEFYNVNIKNEKEIEKAFEKIQKLDILVNNAGIYIQNKVEDTKISDLNDIVDINFKGTYMMCKYSIPLLKKSKGNIVNISSGLGIIPEPESPAYCATKAAIIMLTKSMAQEYANEQLRVNTVLPGPIETPFLKSAFSCQKEIEDYRKLNPMKKIGTVEDVANVVLFLASQKAKFVTGGMYSVDGGESTSSIYSK